MADDDVELDYEYLAQNALRGVVRDVLGMTKALGYPPGEHHFYIEFLTHAPGVAISDMLKEQYPERMTIVLQHQFEGLDVSDDEFQVTLHFQGMPDTLVIPFAAVTQFADPSANFALQFQPMYVEEEEHHAPEGPAAVVETLHQSDRKSVSKDDGDEDGPDDGGGAGGADVVSLDRFRKK